MITLLLWIALMSGDPKPKLQKCLSLSSSYYSASSPEQNVSIARKVQVFLYPDSLVLVSGKRKMYPLEALGEDFYRSGDKVIRLRFQADGLRLIIICDQTDRCWALMVLPEKSL